VSSDLPYRAFAPWLLERYGRAVHRVALDAGSSCPNRDGSKGFGGCTYCDVEGSGTGALRSGRELAQQLADGLARVARRGIRGSDPVGAIAYFQSYSNTYVEIARLRDVLATVEPYIGGRDAPVVAVSVATRPDTLSEAALDVLEELARRTDVWVELGLETASDAVQHAIRRFHTLADFEDAARRVRARGLLCVGHAILGLPGDGREGARRTAQALAASGVEGVKAHQLMVLRRTQLEKAWRAGEVATLGVDEYVAWLADFVERLGPEQVLHRLTADAGQEELLAPQWPVGKNVVREQLVAELGRRGTRQGTPEAAGGAATAVRAQGGPQAERS
jgi:hypothetical protein